VGSKQRVVLTLKEVVKMAPNVWDFVFTPSEKLSFKAGQYAEWTIPLGHEKHDERGNRRYFTIASAPSEGAVRLGVKFYPEPSAFKEELQALKVGDEVMLGQVTGDFTLPAKPVPLLFLAGGIGVTPFRSMLAEMVAAGTPQDVTLVYAATSFEEVVYRDVLEGAKALGVRIILLLGKPEGVTEGWEVASGFITPELLTQLVPDAKERSVYISGPNRFVDSAKQSCKVCGVPSGSLVTDYFPGY
jgi:ferredoxin-NADP reductase